MRAFIFCLVMNGGFVLAGNTKWVVGISSSHLPQDGGNKVSYTLIDLQDDNGRLIARSIGSDVEDALGDSVFLGHELRFVFSRNENGTVSFNCVASDAALSGSILDGGKIIVIQKSFRREIAESTKFVITDDFSFEILPWDKAPDEVKNSVLRRQSK